LLRVAKPGAKTGSEYIAALSSVRAFCGLELPGKFKKISSNTLKSITQQGGIPDVYAPAYPSQWDYFLNLLAEARANVQTQLTSGKHASQQSILQISDEEKIKQAHLHAHLCSMAFSDLYGMLTNFLITQEDLSEIARHRIQRQLDQSAMRFKHLHSPAKLKSGQMNLVKD
jgi:hypothetical protein